MVRADALTEFKHLQKQTEKSAKRNQQEKDQFTPFDLYVSVIEIGNNCIQVTVGDTKNMYLTLKD